MPYLPLNFVTNPDLLLEFVAQSVGRMIGMYLFIKLIELGMRDQLRKHFGVTILVSTTIVWLLACAAKIFPVIPGRHFDEGLLIVQCSADLISALLMLTVRQFWHEYRIAKMVA